MTDIDLLLRRWAPRPGIDPSFRDSFERLILAGALEEDVLPMVAGGRRRLYTIGGAVVGAALAVGAATVGWLRWGRTRQQAA